MPNLNHSVISRQYHNNANAATVKMKLLLLYTHYTSKKHVNISHLITILYSQVVDVIQATTLFRLCTVVYHGNYVMPILTCNQPVWTHHKS